MFVGSIYKRYIIMKKQLFLLLLILPLFLGCSKDEVDVMGDVYGKIIDSETGNPIYGAEIILKPGNRTVVSGNDGAYEFVELEAGQYNISVTASDYDFNSRYVEVLPGERVACDILMTKSSEIYDLEITPEVLDFGTVLTEKSLKIKNIGTTPTDWSLNLGSNRMWLSADPEMGNIAGGKTQTITFSIDRSLISSEKNVTAHLIAFGNSYPISIVCNHEVAKGSLQISKSTLDFGTDLDELAIEIYNTGNGPLEWSVKDLPSYISLSETNGTLSAEASKIVTVRIDRDEILTDVNTNIVITDGDESVAVSIVAKKPKGKISVSATSLDFGLRVDEFSFEISNIGNASINWEISLEPYYLFFSETSGTLSAGASKIVTVKLERDFMFGDVNDYFYVETYEQRIKIPITAQKAKVGLQVSKSSLVFGSDLDKLTFEVSNIGNIALGWEIKDLPSYLSVSPEYGSLSPNSSTLVTATIDRKFMPQFVNTSISVSDGSNIQTIQVNATNPVVEDYSSATIVSCDYRVEAKIVSCKRSGSEVVFKYKLKNTGLGDVRDFRIYPPNSSQSISGGYNSVVFDNLENTYPKVSMKFGTETTIGGGRLLASELYQDVPYSGEVILSDVPESATEITVMLGVFVYNHTPDILSRKVYFKNVPIF